MTSKPSSKTFLGTKEGEYELSYQKPKKKKGKLSKKAFRLSDRGFLLLTRGVCLLQKRFFTNTHSKLVRSFTTWHFITKSHPLKIPDFTQEQDEQLTKTRATILKAFKEYENVTSKYSMEEALFQEKVQKIKTVNGCKVILIIMHLRYLNTLKSSFDKMKVFAEHREDIVTLQHEVDEISETFEKLSVTEADIKEIEETNSKLQITMLVKLSVQRLRIHAILTTLYSTRERNRNMRKMFFDEVTAIKEALHKYDDMDAALVENCVAAKEKYVNALTNTREHLEDALQLHTTLKKNFDDAIGSQMQVEKEITASKLATGVT